MGLSMLRPYDGTSSQSFGGDEASGGSRRQCSALLVASVGEGRGQQAGDLGFVGVANYVGYPGEGGQFFGGALSIAASDDDLRRGVVGMKFADGVAGLGVGSCGDGTSIKDHDVGGGCRVGQGAATIQELALDGGTVGLGGPTAELLNVEGGHCG